MTAVGTLRQEREAILQELSGLEQIRRGSVTEQMIETLGPDGSKRSRGPYPLYTFKEGGKTVSRRLNDPDQIPIYRQQIRQWRRFSELVERLRVLGEELSDRTLQEDAVKKTPNTKSKKNSKPPTSSND